jgi:hypothetical protein
MNIFPTMKVMKEMKKRERIFMLFMIFMVIYNKILYVNDIGWWDIDYVVVIPL